MGDLAGLEEDFTGFLDTSKKQLKLLSSYKKKHTKAKQVPFLMKEINKEIMNRLRLRNKFLRCRSNENKKTYNDQCNRYVKLVRSTKHIIEILTLKTLMTIKYLGKQLNSFSLKK